MPDLADEITAEADVSFEGGRTNNLSDLGCSIGAIVASFGAILKEMEDRWSELVRTGTPPPVKSPHSD